MEIIKLQKISLEYEILNQKLQYFFRKFQLEIADQRRYLIHSLEKKGDFCYANADNLFAEVNIINLLLCVLRN